jgi:hypothetical protein
VGVGAGRLSHLARVPAGPADAPGHHVLETAEASASLTRRLVGAKPIADLDRLAAPGAGFSVHLMR